MSIGYPYILVENLILRSGHLLWGCNNTYFFKEHLTVQILTSHLVTCIEGRAYASCFLLQNISIGIDQWSQLYISIRQRYVPTHPYKPEFAVLRLCEWFITT
jgi:hypothetical protein